MATKNRGRWIAILFILGGLVIGGLLGDLAANVDWLWWLSFGESFGLETPLQLNLSILKITFSFMVKINMASIVGVVIALYIYRKV